MSPATSEEIVLRSILKRMKKSLKRMKKSLKETRDTLKRTKKFLKGAKNPLGKPKKFLKETRNALKKSNITKMIPLILFLPLTLIFTLGFFATPANTSSLLEYSCSGSCLTSCFISAGRTYDISPNLLWAIAKVESNFNHGAVSYNKNGSYDYGIMQINSSWYRHLGHDRWMALADPCYSIYVGAWMLKQCINKHGYTWEAVGCYNASSKHKRNKYAWVVYKTLKEHSDR